MTRRTQFRLPGLGRYVPPMGSEFVNVEAAGGIVLVVATLTAIGLANSTCGPGVADFWHIDLTIGVGSASITESLQHWVSDGLMCLFFFVVGLEIKRELVVGELRDRRAAQLPVFAALGGMVLPALIFVAINLGGVSVRGWGVPMATDIAFALGLLALLGNRISPSAKLFLLALAIVDDIGAILVIAVFYTNDLAPWWLIGAVAVVGLIVAMRRARVAHPLAYVLPGLALWVCVLESGVHATIAAVMLGLLTPAHPVRGRPVLEQLEHRFHPIASFAVLPIFALANAGIVLDASSVSAAASSRVTWGIVGGLVVGKTIGIALACYLATRFTRVRLPKGTTLGDIAGLAAVAGIGFTVSLFIADLSFIGSRLDEAKIGILAGSILAAAIGATTLVARARPRDIAQHPDD